MKRSLDRLHVFFALKSRQKNGVVDPPTLKLRRTRRTFRSHTQGRQPAASPRGGAHAGAGQPYASRIALRNFGKKNGVVDDFSDLDHLVRELKSLHQKTQRASQNYSWRLLYWMFYFVSLITRKPTFAYPFPGLRPTPRDSVRQSVRRLSHAPPFIAY